MRITNGMLVNNMMNNLNNNLNRMARYQNQGASGRKFDKPSDDPIGMSKSLKLYTDISKVEQYERNLNDANSWMHTTEEALKEIELILQRTRELTTEASNGTKTDVDTKNISEEIKQMKEQLIKLGNTRHAGRSIFTGFKTDKDLFQSNGAYNINLGKSDVSIYNVGISEDIEVNVVGSRVFGFVFGEGILKDNLKGNLADFTVDDAVDSKELIEMKNRKQHNLDVIKGKLGGLGLVDGSNNAIDFENIKSYDDLKNLLATPENVNKIEEFLGMHKGSTEISTPAEASDGDKLWFKIINQDGDIKASENDQSSMIDMFDKLVGAMEKGDYDEISNFLDKIDLVHQNVISIKSEIGAKTNRLDMTKQRLSSEKLNFNTNLSQNEDVDFAELLMKSNLAETVYNISLAISSKVIQPTLVDFLR